MWWCIAAALLVLAAVLYVRGKWVLPWRELHRLVVHIARGEQPATFLVSGNPHAWRIGVALEDMLTRERTLQRDLGEARVEIRGIFAALRDAVVVVDAEQRVRFSNSVFEQLFAGREIPAGATLLDALRDADIAEAVQKTLREGAVSSLDITRDDKTFALSAVPMQDNRGALTGAIAILHDITELKQTDRIRRDFVANLSHELRTPLSIFRGNLETLIDDEELSDEERRYIYAVMQRHANRLIRLLQDLLTLSRLESSETRLELKPIDVDAFLRRVARDWSDRIQQKRLLLRVQTASNLPHFAGDEFRLEQVLHNLLDNATNYSPVAGEIVLGAEIRGDRIVLSVRDEGPGIPPADLPRIFERFYRVDKARSRDLGSTGLGLSIVKHIAQLHGGDVHAESDLGKGTTVALSLPVEHSRGVTKFT
ncbi:MAG: PAS domain-containing protein [Verrucomicrobia bacterium]|nr:PAS domain-containing protein [Verrucomicrobiota bacterium]